MFKWFKRREKAPEKPKPQVQRPARRTAYSGEFPPSLPLPEVVAEGNTQADWSVWEDSMTTLDSQLQGLAPSSRFQVRDTRPSQLDEIDPFAGVRLKRKG
jgi:hypothetical protein